MWTPFLYQWVLRKISKINGFPSKVGAPLMASSESATAIFTDLNSGFSEAEPHRQGLSHEDIWVVRGLKSSL